MTNVVLLGLKGHQGCCLDEIARREDVRLAGVQDDDPTVLEGLRGRSYTDQQTLFTTSPDELLALPQVDVAILCEDNAARPGNLLACAERGWHIMAEKPLALSLEDLGAVREAVERAGVRLSMLLTMRFEPPYLAMRHEVAAGSVGRPLLMSAQKSYRRGIRPAWQRDRATFGGTIPFIGIHALDMLQWQTGCRYRRVAAAHHNERLPGAGDIEETAIMLLETDAGQMVDIRCDYLRPGKAPTHGDDRFRVAGSDGVIEAIGGEVSLLTAAHEPRVLAQPEGQSIFGSFLDELAGRGRHPITAAECFAITEVALKARQAAETGEWVSV
ncbi:MAG: Gfo/Idh/MocA family oxidoreductase [Armatimonadetes bacterium]|nr:Gfo/Idh/MocA family oxidoreductase [Armatimonadota bacterium]